MNKTMRLLALVLAVFVVLIMGSFSAFLITEAEHDCAGDHCLVCCQLTLCRQLLRGLGAGIWALSAAISAIWAYSACLRLRRHFCRAASLVSLNVRLSI